MQNIDSKILLRDTMRLIREAGYELGNIDATIAAERPKLNPHIPAMKQTLAEVMQVDEDDISIKATTTEKLGFTLDGGKVQGVCYCTDSEVTRIPRDELHGDCRRKVLPFLFRFHRSPFGSVLQSSYR